MKTMVQASEAIGQADFNPQLGNISFTEEQIQMMSKVKT